MKEKNGIALVLVAGLLTMLGFLAVAFSAGVHADRSGRVSLVRGAAGRAAESGLEYAAARLLRASAVLQSTASNRTDDWAFRDNPAMPVERGVAVSYQRGDHWIDADGDGAFTSGIDTPFPGGDLAGDGRLSTWSGRLRGRSGPFGERFALKIESAGGKIPVNRTVRGSQSLDTEAHRYLLNNLGARVLPAGHPRRVNLATSHPETFIETSRLGDDLHDHAPAGGIANPTDLADTLRRAGYPIGPDGLPLGFPEILPHVTCNSPLELSPQFRVPSPAGERAIPAIEMSTTTLKVLEALWLYASHPPETALWNHMARNETDPKSGLPFFRSNLILYPEDVEALALAVFPARTVSLPRIYTLLLVSAQTSLAVPATLTSGGHLTEAARHAQSRADLAFLCVSPDAPPHLATSPATLHTLGIARQARIGVVGYVPRGPDVSWPGLFRTPIPGGPAYPPPCEEPFVHTGGAGAGPGTLALLTARPPTRFEIGVSGISGQVPAPACAVRIAALETGTPLFLGSQQDLEGIYPPALSGALHRIGITPENDPQPAPAPYGTDTGRRLIGIHGSRAYRQLASLPGWDHRSWPAGTTFPGYSPYFGALTLAGSEEGARGAALYWPFSETISGVQTFPSESGSFPQAPTIPWRGRMGANPLQILPMNPGVGRIHTDSQPLFTPHQVTGGAMSGGILSPRLDALPDGFNFPGFGGLPSQRVELFIAQGCASFCTAPENHQLVFRIEGFTTGLGGPLTQTGEINVVAESTVSPPPGVTTGLTFHCYGHWPSDQGTGGNNPFSFSFSTPVFGGDVLLRPHFFQLEVKYDPLRRTTSIGLHVGSESSAVTLPVNFWFRKSEIIKTYITGVDELRVSGDRFSDSYSTIRGLGRFTRGGSYVSPLYRLDPPRIIRQARWNGALPPGFLSSSLQTVVTLDGIDYPLDTFGVSLDLSGSGPVDAFRYRIDFNAEAVPGPLLDTPVFESIEFVFDRPRSTPLWTHYQ